MARRRQGKELRSSGEKERERMRDCVVLSHGNEAVSGVFFN